MNLIVHFILFINNQGLIIFIIKLCHNFLIFVIHKIYAYTHQYKSAQFDEKERSSVWGHHIYAFIIIHVKSEIKESQKFKHNRDVLKMLVIVDALKCPFGLILLVIKLKSVFSHFFPVAFFHWRAWFFLLTFWSFEHFHGFGKLIVKWLLGPIRLWRFTVV